MSATSRHDLISTLRDLMSATNRADCVVRIEGHMERLFGEFSPKLVLADRDLPRLHAQGGEADDLPEIAFELSARGHLIGKLLVPAGDALSADTADELQAFADHAGLALDNARLLEDHERRARRDPLTGLLNRGEFHDMLATEVARANGNPTESLSLAVFDLDHFKAVNDQGGHSAGDRLLRATAAALTAVCRSTDAAFRIGGDEFALLLPGCDSQDAAAIAERAADAIGRLDGSVGASWGVGTIPSDASTREGLVAVADASMYERKGHTSAATSLLRRDARSRLEVASRLAVRLTELRDPREIAAAVVNELHSAFGYYLAVIHRLDPDDRPAHPRRAPDAWPSATPTSWRGSRP